MHVLISQLLNDIQNRNTEQAVETSKDIMDAIVLKDVDLITSLVTPVVLNQVYEAIINTYSVPQKALMVKKRVHNAAGRAMLFATVINNVLNRVLAHELAR